MLLSRMGVLPQGRTDGGSGLPEKTTFQASLACCPNCGHREMRVFYEVDQIPVHSVMLVADVESAQSYPTRDLKLGFCSGCGFISNVIFDPSVHCYGEDYEETQAFSPTFNRFAAELADRLIRDYRLQGKSVLEIGCGKGEFVALLCEAGMGKGIGLDPAYVPGRYLGAGQESVEYVQEFYGEKHKSLDVDLICCRHTLEHIAATGDFLRLLRSNLEGRPDTLVFFEVPDSHRILKEGAYWDIYYEHCSYFTSGSLARLFRRSGFEVLDLRLEYGEQYLTIVARPCQEGMTLPMEVEEGLEELLDGIRTFQHEFRRSSEHWKSVVQRMTQAGKKVALWGSGSKAVGFITTLQLAEQIHAVVDINPHKQGKYMPGVTPEIVAPEALCDDPVDCVIVMNPLYAGEIGQSLDRLGLSPEIMTL